MNLTAHPINIWIFQSTHPHGVRRHIWSILESGVLFQSTHPHGVRRKRCFQWNGARIISIHAPTRGATRHHVWCILLRNFNPRTHTGCDVQGATLINVDNIISIHAPTRGATAWSPICSTLKTFQSTHPHGVRLQGFCFPSGLSKFQSTHPHGVRRGSNSNARSAR